jgi:hypothetical protein
LIFSYNLSISCQNCGTKVLSEKENTSNDANRHATWLELFYDLVFVVVIFQLAHYLEENFTYSTHFDHLSRNMLAASIRQEEVGY